MKTLLIAAAVATALAGTAQAQSARISDTDYINLARCAGLAEGVGVDASEMEQVLRDQRRGRADHIRERATSARQSAIAEARSDANAATAALAACR
jgi:hypothetical protein